MMLLLLAVIVHVGLQSHKTIRLSSLQYQRVIMNVVIVMFHGISIWFVVF